MIFGDFNIDPFSTRRRLTTDQLLFFDLLNIGGYTIYDIPDAYTFLNHNGNSIIDHVMYGTQMHTELLKQSQLIQLPRDYQIIDVYILNCH